MKFIYIPLLVTFVTSIETTAEPCKTAGLLPVVNICTPDTKQQDNSGSVLIKANTTQNCTCELSVINQKKDISVIIQKFYQRTSSSPIAYGCGLILKFGVGTNTNIWEAQCVVNNSGVTTSIKFNNKMTIKSFTVNGTLKENEGYCIQVKKVSNESDNQLKLTCGIGSIIITNTTQSVKQTTTSTTTTTQTTTVPVTTTVPITTTIPITTTVPRTTIATTISTTSTDTNELDTTIFTSTYSYVTTHKTTQPKHKDNDETITLTVGASVGGLVTIIVVIVMVCVYRQKHPKSTSKRGPAVNTDTNNYGLRDNVLYVSSEPSDTTKIQNNPEFSFDNDGNYSTVDLDEILPVDDLTGDYSSIDLVNLTSTESNINGSTNEKPVIAPKPKQKATIQDDVYSVPDKKRVKHVTAPGEDECEYAVVRKPNKSNVNKSEDQPLTSNVYAVVAKTKLISDGKGTNQKRDSLTSENDRETGRSSKI